MRVNIPRLLVGLSLAFALVPSPARAQLPPGLPVPPQQFAVTHLWGSPSAHNIRNSGLGGCYAAEGKASNPASQMAYDRPSFLVYDRSSSFDLLPKVGAQSVSYAYPLSCGRAVMKIAYSHVSARGAVNRSPVQADVWEGDPAFEMACRVDDKLDVGIGVAYLATDSTFTVPGLGQVTTLRSRPAGLGGRVGAIYHASRTLDLGATIDNYQEHVDQRIPVLGLPARGFTFVTTGYRVGLGWQARPNTRILADYEEISIRGNNTTTSQRPFMAGIEHQFQKVALRVGSYDGKLTGGLGLSYKNWQLDYGFTGRYDKLLPGRGAKTSHALQLIRDF